MRPAPSPRPRAKTRVLAVGAGRLDVFPGAALPERLFPGDVLVVNDAATLPASLRAHTLDGRRIELRLAANVEGASRWTAALLGAGDHRIRTEDRPPPPAVSLGTRLLVDGPDGLVAVVDRMHALSTRLVDVRFTLPLLASPSEASLWAALYRAGRPVQYAHVPEPLALWDVQNTWASRPWAVEMPSAGRVLGPGAIAAFRARGVAVAAITHAAGLSAVGDPAIDRALPLPERYDIPEATVEAVERASRVVAVGTSVVRALEGVAAKHGGALVPGEGITDLRLDRATRRSIVTAVLTGVHDEGTSHHTLLEAFVPASTLQDAFDTSVEQDFVGHEMGDLWLVWGKPPERSRPRPTRTNRTPHRNSRSILLDGRAVPASRMLRSS